MGRYNDLLAPSKPPVKQEEKPENLISGIPENLKPLPKETELEQIPETLLSGKPENLKTRKSETVSKKAEKYSTQLQTSTIKKIKQYAIEHDIKDYEVVEAAIEYYVNRYK